MKNKIIFFVLFNIFCIIQYCVFEFSDNEQKEILNAIGVSCSDKYSNPNIDTMNNIVFDEKCQELINELNNAQK